jgi:preprotein translocase subunit YajC
MKQKFKKELKFSSDLEVGDDIKVGGLLCTVKKVETIFHHRPDSRVRVVLTAIGATPKNAEIVLFLPHGAPIETLK